MSEDQYRFPYQNHIQKPAPHSYSIVNSQEKHPSYYLQHYQVTPQQNNHNIIYQIQDDLIISSDNQDPIPYQFNDNLSENFFSYLQQDQKKLSQNQKLIINTQVPNIQTIQISQFLTGKNEKIKINSYLYLTRKQRVQRYRFKKNKRKSPQQKIRYKKRKIIAQGRARIKGRFVKKQHLQKSASPETTGIEINQNISREFQKIIKNQR